MQRIFCDCCEREVEKDHCFNLFIERMDGNEYYCNGVSCNYRAEICEDCEQKIIEFIEK